MAWAGVGVRVPRVKRWLRSIPGVGLGVALAVGVGVTSGAGWTSTRAPALSNNQKNCASCS